MKRKCLPGCTCGLHRRRSEPAKVIANAGRETRAFTATGEPRRFPAPVYVHGRLLTEKGIQSEW